MVESNRVSFCGGGQSASSPMKKKRSGARKVSMNWVSTAIKEPEVGSDDGECSDEESSYYDGTFGAHRRKLFDDEEEEKVVVLVDGGIKPGGFEIFGRLGSGEFSEVFAARKEGRAYAIKSAKKPFKSRKAREVALSEAKILRGIGSSHPNVVGFYGAWQEESRLHVAMELCRGSVKDLYERSFGDAPLWVLARDVARALHHVHNTAGVAHLDVKPANVLVSPDGVLKLADFGHATPFGTIDHEGDAHYVAPELFSGGPVAPHNDIFSLGLSLYELLADVRLPVHGPEWHRLRELTLPYPVTFPPRSLQELVSALTLANPNERPGTADLVRTFDDDTRRRRAKKNTTHHHIVLNDSPWASIVANAAAAPPLFRQSDNDTNLNGGGPVPNMMSTPNNNENGRKKPTTPRHATPLRASPALLAASATALPAGTARKNAATSVC